MGIYTKRIFIIPSYLTKIVIIKEFDIEIKLQKITISLYINK